MKNLYKHIHTRRSMSVILTKSMWFIKYLHCNKPRHVSSFCFEIYHIFIWLRMRYTCFKLWIKENDLRENLLKKKLLFETKFHTLFYIFSIMSCTLLLNIMLSFYFIEVTKLFTICKSLKFTIEIKIKN